MLSKMRLDGMKVGKLHFFSHTRPNISYAVGSLYTILRSLTWRWFIVFFDSLKLLLGKVYNSIRIRICE